MLRRTFLKLVVGTMVATVANGIFTEQVQFNRRQYLALTTLQRSEISEVVFGGGKGGGKSVFGSKWAEGESIELIRKFDIQPSKTPLLIGFMGRKRNSDFVKTTLETWKEWVSPRIYHINESKQEIVILDRVKWYYGGFDDRAGIEKFNSGEYCRLFIDQAEEITEREYSMVGGTMRRKIKGFTVPRKELYTCNPAQCWIKREFVRNPNRQEMGRAFVQALAADNPFLADDYVKTLRHKYRNQPELLKAYIEGSWDAIESDNQLIKDLWIRESRERPYPWPRKRKIISVDVARYGDDRTVIGYAEETDLREVIIYGKKGNDYTVNKVARLGIRKSEDGTPKTAPMIVVDADGIGGPLGDDLLALGFNVLMIESQGKSSDPSSYHNLRAEMWWNASLMYADGDVYNSYGDMVPDDIVELDTELTVVGYSLKVGRILVQDKDEIKDARHYGKSPDLADMYIMLLYGLTQITPDKVIQKVRARRNLGRGTSAMAG